MARRRSGLFFATVVVLSCAGGAPATDGSGTATGGAATPATAAVVTATAPAPTVAATPKGPWRAATAPPGGPPPGSGNEAPEGTRWIEIDSFDGRAIFAAIYAPEGSAAAPVVIHLHGDGGMQRRDLEFGISLAKDGFLAVVPCWQGPIARSPRALGCTSGAALRRSTSDLAKEISAIADAARTLPGARADRVVVMGHSGGGAAALLAGSTGARVDAVVAANAPYPTGQDEVALAGGIKARWGATPTETVGGLSVPLLIMHGVDDRTGPATFVEAARAYEKAARDLGKNVEAIYVQPGGHEFVFFPALFTPPLRARFVAFIKG